MAASRFSLVVPAVLAGSVLFLNAAATPAQSWMPAGSSRYAVERPNYETFSAVVGRSAPLFLTSINYPGVYGAYTYGVPAYAYNTRTSAPTYHGILEPIYLTTRPATDVLPPATPAADLARRPAYVNVHVPSEAGLWIQDVKMGQPGSVREFVSPPLAPGEDYTYTVLASWTENGREVVQKRVVHVAAGDRVDVDLLTASTPPQSSTTLRARPLP
jgi:uncharacterized protein (TIGR03000 family)